MSTSTRIIPTAKTRNSHGGGRNKAYSPTAKGISNSLRYIDDVVTEQQQLRWSTTTSSSNENKLAIAVQALIYLRRAGSEHCEDDRELLMNKFVALDGISRIFEFLEFNINNNTTTDDNCCELSIEFATCILYQCFRYSSISNRRENANAFVQHRGLDIFFLAIDGYTSSNGRYFASVSFWVLSVTVAADKEMWLASIEAIWIHVLAFCRIVSLKLLENVSNKAQSVKSRLLSSSIIG